MSALSVFTGTLGAQLSSKLGFVVQIASKLPGLKKVAVGVLLVVTLMNFKNWPLVWHGRFYYSLYDHLFRRKKQLPSPSHIFAPISWISRSSWYECDLNLHKSNSTYFSDLDIARTHLIAALIKKSLAIRQKQKQSLYVALAGTQCLFRREIKPFEKYEVVTRLLTWDAKWVWVVSHFVKVGGGKTTTDKDGKTTTTERKIYATALSKYVFKNGRITVAPEEILRESGLLPERPTTAGDSKPTAIPSESDKKAIVAEYLQSTLKVDGFEGEWTWERIESERVRALEVTKHMLAMDTLDDEYVGTGREKGALGVFRSLA
ncbi:hypothetical protein BJ508DRAFT_411936 [Ascobolus immersus RN42]|uniref:Thioesterase/thiol ester dehydrase-isomerase n=1 Tax=Ascobolus immersus RN42 TaxID=1160509 RepID=A0A3N4IJC2_ASCIM|nr:hypothetical protein BJ508DRAFT_411936 [Ascobolus immersus RN42]